MTARLDGVLTVTARGGDGAAVTLKILAYEPETYYSLGAAGLNTTIADR